MKRLRRFNESVEGIDKDYIYQCFAELIDDERAEIHENHYGFDNIKYITVNLITKRYPDDFNKSQTIDKSPLMSKIDAMDYNNEIMQEVKVALTRLSEKYPNYRINADFFLSSFYINIFAEEDLLF